jgi:molybdate transport repressor ModE-like protein
MPDDMSKITKLKPNWKIWLEDQGTYVFGPGAYSILKSIRDTGTITKGAQSLGMSYRYAWGVIRKIERQLGVKLIMTHKGGIVGGGGATITDAGLKLIELYQSIVDAFEEVSPR